MAPAAEAMVHAVAAGRRAAVHATAVQAAAVQAAAVQAVVVQAAAVQAAAVQEAAAGAARRRKLKPALEPRSTWPHSAVGHLLTWLKRHAAPSCRSEVWMLSGCVHGHRRYLPPSRFQHVRAPKRARAASVL